MAVIRTQICEMCGQARTLAANDKEDMSGWRNLSSGSKQATLCSTCVNIIVGHALDRARARQSGRLNTPNALPFTVSFAEYGA